MSRPIANAPAAAGGGSLHHVDTSVLDSGQPFNPPPSENLPGDAGREGDLLFSLLDPKTQRTLWSASANGVATTPAEALRKARATYAEMVAQLPKAGGGTP